MKKWLYFITWVTFGAAFALMFTIFLWIIWPYHLVDFKADKFPVSPKVVQSGKSITYTVDYCKYTNITATVSRSFADGIIFPLQVQTTDRPKGCHVGNISIMVPRTLEPGEYFLIIQYRWKVNPLREISITKNTESFTVTNSNHTD